MEKYDLVVIGGGAAGFMAAITAAESGGGKNKIVVLEKSNKVLAKVRVSGGGRCNVTHRPIANKVFAKNYPRGEKLIQKLLEKFNAEDTISWFEKRGVDIKIEADGRAFPKSNTSETIIDCLNDQSMKGKVEILTQCGVKNINVGDGGYEIDLLSEKRLYAKRLIIATGGGPSNDSYNFLKNLAHNIVPPVPSLFTFNISDQSLVALAGASINNGKARIAGSKLQAEGPILITHWGLSGPAILKLSAWGARELALNNYKFKLLVNWCNGLEMNDVSQEINLYERQNERKLIVSNPLFQIPQRMWQFLCAKSEIDAQLRWIDISNKKRNKLLENLVNCGFDVVGKSTFKDEFVTCGGVSLEEINFDTMESKRFENLYFCGEVLDIDAITGGFNFQNAWASGYVAGKSCMTK